MATRAIIGFPRVTGDFTLAGGAWDADYPITNLQSLPLSQVARSTTTSATIIGTSATTRRVGLIGVPRHNFSLSATIRLRLYADAGLTSLTYDTGMVDVWPEVYPYGSLEWEDDNFWTGKYLASELAGTNWLWLWWIGIDHMVAGIQIDISDPSNLAGYVQAGYLELAAQSQLSYNFDWGAQYGPRFRTQVTEALGGTKYFDRRDKPRQFSGILKLPSTEALARHLERLRQLDLVEPFLWLPNPDDVTNWIREAMLCQNLDPGPFSYAFFGNGSRFDQVPIKLEEVIG